jgi:hypothetical protein
MILYLVYKCKMQMCWGKTQLHCDLLKLNRCEGKRSYRQNAASGNVMT